MKKWSFYDPKTGHFSGVIFGSTHPQALEVNLPKGMKAMEGEHDHLSRRVDLSTGTVVDYQPPQPSANHEWDAVTKRWRLSAAAQQKWDARETARSEIAGLERSLMRPMCGMLLGHNTTEELRKIYGRIEQLEKTISTD